MASPARFHSSKTTLGAAVEAFFADRDLAPATRRAYRATYGSLIQAFGYRDAGYGTHGCQSPTLAHPTLGKEVPGDLECKTRRVPSSDRLLPATAFQELSQLPQLHPDHVLMGCRDAGVEADARERADLAFGVAKNPIALDSILARFSGPSRGRFRHGHNLYLLAMPWQSFPRSKSRRTGALSQRKRCRELLQDGHTRTLRVIFHTVAVQTPS